MNWNHWHKELSKEEDSVSDRMWELAEKSQMPSGIWLAEEVDARSKIDTICNSYAETKSWPINMSQKQVVLVYFRLVQAVNRAQELAQASRIHNQSSAELDSERAAALKYLLVEYWNSDGRRKWLTS